MAGGAAVAAAAGLWMWLRFAPLTNAAKRGGSAAGAAPALSEEETVNAFKTINLNMKRIMAQLLQNVKALAGQIDQEQLHAVIIGEFERRLGAVQEEVLKELNTDEEELEEATEFYVAKGNDELKAQVTALRELYISFGGRIEEDLPDDLTVEKVCAALEDYTSAMHQAQEIAVMEMQKTGGQMTPEAQEMLSAMAQKRGADALSKHDMNLSIFQSAMSKFQTDPKFKAKVQEIEKKAQMRQQMAQQMGMM